MPITRTGNVTALGNVSADFYNTYEASLEMLANGNLVATVRTGTFGLPNQNGPSQLRTAVLNQSGAAQSTFQLVDSGDAATYVGGADVGSVGSGSFVLAWEKGPNNDSGPDTSDVYARIYNANGTAATAVFAVPANIANGEFDIQAINLSNGNFLLTWSDLGSSVLPNLDTEIMGQVFTPAGVRVGGEFQINASIPNLQLGHEVLTLTDGRILAVWGEGVLMIDPVTGQPSGIAGSAIEARFLTSAGAVTGSDVLLAVPTSGFQLSDESDSLAVVALAGGGFALLWTEDNSSAFPSAATYNLRIQTFNANGIAVAATTTVRTLNGIDTTQDNGDAFEELEVFAAEAGNLVVYWHEQTTPNSQPNPYAAVVASNGNVVVGATNLEAVPGTFAGDIIAVELLPNGQLMAITAQNNGSGTLSYSTILFDLGIPGSLINGTAGDDPNLIGTGLADTINGLGGVDVLNGQAGNDSLFGGDGADVLQGGVGNDSMFGGAASDNYYLDSAGDVVTEAAGAAEGTVDTVFFTNVAGATLSANVEYGYSLGTTASLTGNTGDNVLIGAYATVVQTLYGGDGNDFLAGTPVGDTLYGGVGVDDLRGFAGNDQMYGGDGNDSYYVEQAGDAVFENLGAIAGANDIIYTSADITMAANVETLFSYGAATNIAGNADANAMLGVYSTHGVTLSGAGGNDLLYGSNFADRLNGGADNDTMFGDAGGSDGFADTLTGGAGNDTYFLTDAADVAVEAVNEGTDVVYARSNYTLLADFETLFIYGAATSGTGNSAANALIGSYIGTGVTLDGSGGTDVVIGGAGNDTIIGGAGVDTLTGAGGNDTFTFNVGDAAGDFVNDFTGNGAAAGDSLRFVGYGVGATFTQINATQWQVNYGAGLLSHDIITFSNAAAIDASDYLFV